MPRKLRTVKQKTNALPSAAWTYALLAGEYAPVRIAGWVSQAQAGRFGEPSAADIWATHEDALVAEAEAQGFAVAWLSDRVPTGPRFDQWRTAFLEQHQY